MIIKETKMPNREQPFSAAVRPAGATAVIDLSGEINGRADETLDAAYAQARELAPAAVLLNFTRVDYINSTGIALIVGLLAQARKDRLELLTCGLSEHYEEIFRITRLADFMTIYHDEAAALGQPSPVAK
jgi:anti-anti-sigma factor